MLRPLALTSDAIATALSFLGRPSARIKSNNKTRLQDIFFAFDALLSISIPITHTGETSEKE